jgi:hypothetical protein
MAPLSDVPPPANPPERPTPPTSPAPPSAPQPPAPPWTRRPRGPRESRIVLGLIVLVIGVAWLLGSLGVSVQWRVILPAALIAVGLALVAGLGRGRHGGLVTIGVILTVVLALASTVNVSLEGGIGDRTFRPASAASVRSEYNLAVGTLTIDLRAVAFPAGDTRIKTTLGTGTLIVDVPSDVSVRVVGHTGAGDIQVFDQQESGVGVGHTFTQPGFAQAQTRLLLDLSVGLGTIEVTT